jgi:hypothetical protein
VEKSNFGKFWLFLEFFGKLTFFETIPITTIAQNSIKLKEFEEKKKIILRFSGEKSSEKTEMML